MNVRNGSASGTHVDGGNGRGRCNAQTRRRILVCTGAGAFAHQLNARSQVDRKSCRTRKTELADGREELELVLPSSFSKYRTFYTPALLSLSEYFATRRYVNMKLRI